MELLINLQREREREREREDGRAQESSERLISLLERMLNKYIIRQEKTVGKNGYITIFQYLFFLNVTLSMKQPNFCSLFCDVSEKLNE